MPGIRLARTAGPGHVGPPTIPMPEEMLHEVGAFEPHDAKKILDAFEARGVPFEIEADNRDLLSEGRDFQQQMGMCPPGSRLIIFVREAHLAQAQAIIAEMFPV